MKNVCLVLRNKQNSVLTPDFAPVTDAFLSGGYALDEVCLLPYDDIRTLHEKVRFFLQNSALLCVVVDPVLLNGVKNNLAQTFSLAFEEDSALFENVTVCVLPAGEEGKNIVANKIVPLLNERLGVCYDKMVFRMVGAPQETLQKAIDAAYAVSGDDLYYNYIEKFADGRLEIVYNSQTPKMLADKVVRVLLGILEEYVYALEDISLEKRLYDALVLRKARLSVCESFTGGGISSRIVKIPGASGVFSEGLNTYSNQSKKRRLSVSEESLTHYGAVSAQVAYEMAEGLLKTGDCNVCVATTGIAGPKADSSKKPVGLCYIAAGIENQIFVNEYIFQGDRECITQTAINYALFALFKLLKQ